MGYAEKIVCLYLIISPNGSVYVGQTRDKKTRLNRYKNYLCKSQSKVYRSLLKYGYESHDVSIIIKFNNDIEQELLSFFEMMSIRFFKDNGIELLNLTDGGEGGNLSEETKLKMSETHKRNKTNVGFKHTDETRKKMSISRIGNKNHNYGKPKTAEIKAKMSASHKGKSHNWNSKEDRLNWIESVRVSHIGEKNHFYGKKHTPESIEKMKKAHIESWAKRKNKIIV